MGSQQWPPTGLVCEHCAPQAFELFYDFMVDNEAQQGRVGKHAGRAAGQRSQCQSVSAEWRRQLCPGGSCPQWDVFMAQLQPLASQVPWMLTEGVRARAPLRHSMQP